MGMKCRVSKYQMYAEREDDQPQGWWVYCVCQTRQARCTNREKSAKSTLAQGDAC